MMPCAIHNVMMSGKGTATECTHLVCDKCVEENERLRAALKEIGVLSDYAESLDPGPVSVIVNKALQGEFCGKKRSGK